MASKKLGVNNRKAIFIQLVELQDSGITVRDSKQQILDKFGIEDEELQAIEDEGLDQQWPPLGVADPKLANGCGVGTQFQVIDINGDGKLDIVTSNKKGVHLIEQP